MAVLSCPSPGIGMLLACLGLATIAGCSDQPTPPPRFQIDPQQAAQKAMELYDKNGDGTLDAKELKASPPLADLLQNLKAHSPGHPDSLTVTDISGRIDEWLKNPTTLISGAATVYLDGQPLAGATVTYEPEPFLGPSYHPHQGQTDTAGMAQLDAELKNYSGGIYVGLYRVRISKKVNGKETIPARYNAETELGREVASGVRDARESIIFRLKSK
jgi:hypothetical protein